MYPADVDEKLKKLINYLRKDEFFRWFCHGSLQKYNNEIS